MFCCSLEVRPHPCFRVRFPVKGIEFSTVNHPEKKLNWGENSLPLGSYVLGLWREEGRRNSFQGW